MSLTVIQFTIFVGIIEKVVIFSYLNNTQGRLSQGIATSANSFTNYGYYSGIFDTIIALVNFK